MKRYLLLFILFLVLTSCNSGSSNPVASQLNNNVVGVNNNYFIKYPINNTIRSSYSRIGNQIAFTPSNNVSLTQITVNYYGGSTDCSGSPTNTTFMGDGTTTIQSLTSGTTYTSTDQSNYELCNVYTGVSSGGCALMSTAAGPTLKSIQYKYSFQGGLSALSQCYYNSGNSYEALQNYSGSPAACTSGQQCGLSTVYSPDTLNTLPTVVICLNSSTAGCYISINGNTWAQPMGSFSGRVQNGAVIIDSSGTITACISIFLCYRSVNGTPWVAIPAGTSSGAILRGGLVSDSNGNITACSTTSPFICYRSVNGESLATIPTGTASGLLKQGGVAIDSSGNLTACNNANPFKCYRSVNGGAWTLIGGTTTGTFAPGGIVSDAAGNVTACNGSTLFACYRSANGGAWTLIGGTTTGTFTPGGIVSDAAGNVTACNNVTPFTCYRSVAGADWTAIPAGTTSGAILRGGLVSDSSDNITACNNVTPFTCYRSANGGSWTTIGGTTSGALTAVGIVVDSNGNITACNDENPFACYRSVAGADWVQISNPSVIAATISQGNVTAFYGGSKGRFF